MKALLGEETLADDRHCQHRSVSVDVFAPETELILGCGLRDEQRNQSAAVGIQGKVDTKIVRGTNLVELAYVAGTPVQASDYANAVKVYDKLVGLAPKVAAFHLRLAVAMACYPRTAKLAEREFYEAARIEPDNAEVHYQWGLYYKVMKIKSRAVAEMRTAVRLNPRHKNARSELEQLSPKDSALTSLKKLFK